MTTLTLRCTYIDIDEEEKKEAQDRDGGKRAASCREKISTVMPEKTEIEVEVQYTSGELLRGTHHGRRIGTTCAVFTENIKIDMIQA